MVQLGLFDLGPPRLPFAEGGDDSPLRGLELDSEEPQLALFTERVQLLGELLTAIERADFRRAFRARAELERVCGPVALPAGASILELFGPDFWEVRRVVADRIARWEEADAGLARADTGFRRLVRRGIFSRLLAAHRPADLVAARPTSLAPLANVLRELERPSEARILVRDALVTGRSLSALELEDGELADLLAADRSPRWLAVVGALRRLWPVAWPEPEAIAELSRGVLPPDPGEDDERAGAFWRCLAIAQLQGGVAETTLHAARRWMKRLDPALHDAYMTGTPPST